MKNIIWIFAIGCLIIVPIFLGISSCIAGGDVHYKNYSYDNVHELLMHEPHRYTLINLEKNGKAQMIQFTLDWNVDFAIFFDVEDGEQQRAIFKWQYLKPSSLDGYIITLVSSEIHLHKNGKIGGAGWNHGKFGSGRTNVIESNSHD